MAVPIFIRVPADHEAIIVLMVMLVNTWAESYILHVDELGGALSLTHKSVHSLGGEMGRQNTTCMIQDRCAFFCQTKSNSNPSVSIPFLHVLFGLPVSVADCPDSRDRSNN